MADPTPAGEAMALATEIVHAQDFYDHLPLGSLERLGAHERIQRSIQGRFPYRIARALLATDAVADSALEAAHRQGFVAGQIDEAKRSDALLQSARLAGYAEGVEAAAKVAEAMVVTGRAWTPEQESVARALLAAAKSVRYLTPPATEGGET